MIDYKPFRNYFRTLITGGASPVVAPADFANEGEAFDPGKKGRWVEEVAGIDGEERLVQLNNQDLQMTISYNVYTSEQVVNTADATEDLRIAIAEALPRCMDPIGGITIYGLDATRRTSTVQDGWRLSPLDITFNLTGVQDSTPAYPTDGYIEIVSEKTTDLSVTVQHDGTSATGICYAVDGGTIVYTDVAANTNLVLTIPHNSGTPETIQIWPAYSISSGRVGNMTVVNCDNNTITALPMTGLTGLTVLSCDNNSLTSLDVSGFTALVVLSGEDNDLTSVLATGVDISVRTYIGNNDLSEAALIAFTDSLATTTTGEIDYTGNPGTDDFQYRLLLGGDDKGYEWTPSPLEGVATMVSEKTTDISVTVRHDGVDGASGICYSVDGGAIVYTAVAANTSFSLTIPHNSGTPETILIWPATSAVSGRVGNLIYLYCQYDEITDLDLSRMSSLTLLRCTGNPLPSLLATGNNLSRTGNDIGSNLLTEAALIAFVDSLATTTTGQISYGNNTGSAAFETWLAANPTLDKGYIWINA